MISKKKAKTSQMNLIFEINNGQLLLSFLLCRDAVALRVTSKEMREVVESLFLGETVTLVTNLSDWRTCFPVARNVYVSRFAASQKPLTNMTQMQRVIVSCTRINQGVSIKDFLLQIRQSVERLELESYCVFPTSTLTGNMFCRLQQLNVSDCMVNIGDVDVLKVPSSVKVLHALALGGTFYGGTFLKVDISACRGLEELVVSGEHLMLTRDIFASGVLGRLKVLFIRNQDALTDDCLLNCSQLSDLSLVHTNMTSTGVIHIAARLKRFKYNFYEQVEVVDMVKSIPLMVALESLEMYSSSLDDFASLDCSTLVNLRCLDLDRAVTFHSLPPSLRRLKIFEFPPNFVHDRLTDLHMISNLQQQDVDLSGFVSLQSLSINFSWTRGGKCRMPKGLINLQHLERLTVVGSIDDDVDDIVLNRLSTLTLGRWSLPSVQRRFTHRPIKILPWD
eukprot:GILJ01013238.1.p1 GENE.GILJ01013238.1~~GILJ01013238.1.p1  ORF type:complete len:449 (-),score=32.55 GILJ01013238.1:71-1417(-)